MLTEVQEGQVTPGILVVIPQEDRRLPVHQAEADQAAVHTPAEAEVAFEAVAAVVVAAEADLVAEAVAPVAVVVEHAVAVESKLRHNLESLSL